jgi:hypothetical protein
MTGLEERVFGRLPDETWIYPGHGNDSTLGAERPHLAEWRAGAGKGDASASGCESGVLLGAGIQRIAVGRSLRLWCLRPWPSWSMVGLTERIDTAIASQACFLSQ